MSHSLPPHTDADLTVTPATLQRRQILKAGIWAAPVIVLATAAPAAAASTTATLSILNDDATWAYNDLAQKTALQIAVAVGTVPQTPQATVSGIVLTVVVTGTVMADEDVTDASGADWSYTSRSVTGGAYTEATFTFAYSGTITAGARPTHTGTLNFTLPIAVAGSTTTPTVVTFNASAPQANPGTAQDTLNY